MATPTSLIPPSLPYQYSPRPRQQHQGYFPFDDPNLYWHYLPSSLAPQSIPAPALPIPPQPQASSPWDSLFAAYRPPFGTSLPPSRTATFEREQQLPPGMPPQPPLAPALLNPNPNVPDPWRAPLAFPGFFSSDPILPTSAELKGLVHALGTIPRFMYISALFFLPFFYRSRVHQISLEVSMTEYELISLYASGAPSQPIRPKHWETVKRSWNDFIDSILKEWSTLNIISVLLLTAIYNILELGGSGSRLVQCTALMSLIGALMSLIFGCMFVIRFETMRRPYKAMQWARDAVEKSHNTWWNVFVLLALPFVWLTWSLVLFIVCLMAVVWQTPGHETNVHGFPHISLEVQIIVSAFLFLGIIYLSLVIATFSRYDNIDKAWSDRLKQIMQSGPVIPQYDPPYPAWAGYAPATTTGIAVPSPADAPSQTNVAQLLPTASTGTRLPEAVPELRQSSNQPSLPRRPSQMRLTSTPNPPLSALTRPPVVMGPTSNPALARPRPTQDHSPLPFPFGPVVSPRPLPPEYYTSPETTPFIPARLSPLFSPRPTSASAPEQVHSGSAFAHLSPSLYHPVPSPPSPAVFQQPQVAARAQPLFPIAEGEGQEPSSSPETHRSSTAVRRGPSIYRFPPYIYDDQSQLEQSFSSDSHHHQQRRSGMSEHSRSANEGEDSADYPEKHRSSSGSAVRRLPTPFPPDQLEVPAPTKVTAGGVERGTPHLGLSIGSGSGSRSGSPSQSSTVKPSTPSFLSPPPYIAPSSIIGRSGWRLPPSPSQATQDWENPARDGERGERDREWEWERGRGRERETPHLSAYPGPRPYTFSPPEVLTRSSSLPAGPVSVFVESPSPSTQPTYSALTGSPGPGPSPRPGSSRSPSRGDADRDWPSINVTSMGHQHQQDVDVESQREVSPLELYAVTPISRDTSTPMSAYTARGQFDTESEGH